MPSVSAPTLVFDLDGTLVDSVPDLAAALNRLLASRGLAPYSLPETARMVGDGAGVLVKRAFAGRDTAAEEADIASFLADYSAHAAVETRPFPGILEAVQEFAAQGWQLAVCTNKPEAPARSLLNALGFDGAFAAVGGGDSFPMRKPDPGHLLATLQAAGGEAGRAVMAGDHANDVAAARGAGVKCIFAAWGYGPLSMAEGAEAIAERPTDLPELARRLLS